MRQRLPSKDRKDLRWSPGLLIDTVKNGCERLNALTHLNIFIIHFVCTFQPLENICSLEGQSFLL